MQSFDSTVLKNRSASGGLSVRTTNNWAEIQTLHPLKFKIGFLPPKIYLFSLQNSIKSGIILTIFVQILNVLMNYEASGWAVSLVGDMKNVYRILAGKACMKQTNLEKLCFVRIMLS